MADFPPDSPTAIPVTVEMMMRLGQVTGKRFDIERVRHLIEEAAGNPGGDPLAHLSMVVRPLGLRLSPERLPLSEALWHAHLDTPLIFWSKRENQYIIVTHAGNLRVKVALYGDPYHLSASISRAQLASRLGIASVNEVVEVGLIHPLSPAEAASIRSILEDEELSSRYASSSHRAAHSLRDHAPTGHEHHHMPPFRRLLKILHPERRDIFLLLVFALFSGVLYLALPFAVDIVVTNLAFGNQTKPYVQALFIISQVLAACLLLQALIIGFQYYVAELIQRRIFVRTAGDLAYRLPRVQTRAFDKAHGPELVNRFLDVVTVQKNTTFFLLEGINLIAATLIGLILLALYHPMLIAFVTLLVILIIGVTWPLGRRAVDTAIRESRSKYDLVGWFEEIAAYPHMFKGPGGYELAYQRTNALASQYVHARSRHFHVVIRQISGLLIISVVASVALLLMGVWLVLSQQITLGQLVASEIIMSGIVASLIKLGKKLEAWYDTMAATDKLGHLLDLETENETGDIPTTIDPSIGMRVEARDFSFAYEDCPPLFEKIDFTILPGQRIGICGPQGSGVSSMLDLFFALREPNSGHISFDGLDSRNWRLEHLREHVELLRRDEFIDSTIIDNLRLGRPDVSMEEIRNALDTTGLLDDCLRHPDGLNLRLQVGGGPLSTRQRIALMIARALVQKPRLLLIDELFDGLDDETFRNLSSIVFDRRHTWTVVIATRMDEVLQLCDQTIQLGPTSAASTP